MTHDDLDYPPAGKEKTEAEWLDELHDEDTDIRAMAAALESTYQQLGSPVPLEKGHWLALASAIAPYLT